MYICVCECVVRVFLSSLQEKRGKQAIPSSDFHIRQDHKDANKLALLSLPATLLSLLHDTAKKEG